MAMQIRHRTQRCVCFHRYDTRTSRGFTKAPEGNFSCDRTILRRSSVLATTLVPQDFGFHQTDVRTRIARIRIYGGADRQADSSDTCPTREISAIRYRGNIAVKISKSCVKGASVPTETPAESRLHGGRPSHVSLWSRYSVSSDARFAFAFCLEGSAYLRGPGGTSPRLFLIVHRTWTWLDHGPRVVGATSSPALFPSACADRCRWIREARREREKEREGEKQRKGEDKVTRRRRWMEKKHNDGPGIEPVSNLH